MKAERRIGPGTAGARMSRIQVGVVCRDGLPGHPISRVYVVVRNGNYSAFNGYHFQSSDYSSVCCHACGSFWRTKANYVDALPDES